MGPDDGAAQDDATGTARYRLRTYGTPPERSEWVFHHSRTRRHYEAGDRIQSLHRSFNKVAKDAGLPDEFVQHDLRHRRVTTWLAEGKSPAIVQKALGHSDIRTTLGYSHLVRKDLRQLVQERATEEEKRELSQLKQDWPGYTKSPGGDGRPGSFCARFCAHVPENGL